jgi:outer membrane protein TolC
MPAVLFTPARCSVPGPDFRQPAAEVERQWPETGDPAIHTDDNGTADWWTLFNDPVLDSLVQQADERNLPLQVAGLRIMQSRAQPGIAIGSRFPQVHEAAGSLSRVGLSENAPNFNPALDGSFWTVAASVPESTGLSFDCDSTVVFTLTGTR